MKHLLIHCFYLLPVLLLGQTNDTIALQQIDSLIQTATVLVTQHNFEHALLLNSQAEQIAVEKFGRESVHYSDVLYNQGSILYQSLNHEAAKKPLLEALRIRENHIGKYNSKYAQSLTVLGIVYSNTQYV